MSKTPLLSRRVQDLDGAVLTFLHVRRVYRGGVKNTKKSANRGGGKPPHRDALIAGHSTAHRSSPVEAWMIVYDPVGSLVYAYRARPDPDRLAVIFGPSPAEPPVALSVLERDGRSTLPGVGPRTASAIASLVAARPPRSLPPPRVPRVVAAYPVDEDTTPELVLNARVRSLFSARGAMPGDDAVTQEILVDQVEACRSPSDRTFLPADLLVDDRGLPTDANRTEHLMLDFSPALGEELPNPFFDRNGARTDRVAAAQRARLMGATDDDIDEAIIAGPGAPLRARRRSVVQWVGRTMLREGAWFGQLCIAPLALPESPIDRTDRGNSRVSAPESRAAVTVSN